MILSIRYPAGFGFYHFLKVVSCWGKGHSLGKEGKLKVGRSRSWKGPGKKGEWGSVREGGRLLYFAGFIWWKSGWGNCTYGPEGCVIFEPCGLLVLLQCGFFPEEPGVWAYRASFRGGMYVFIPWREENKLNYHPLCSQSVWGTWTSFNMHKGHSLEWHCLNFGRCIYVNSLSPSVEGQ